VVLPTPPLPDVITITRVSSDSASTDTGSAESSDAAARVVQREVREGKTTGVCRGRGEVR